MIQNIQTYPFNEKHLNKLKKEITKAGTFDNLMLKKKALKRKMGMKYICLIKNIEDYKRKYVTGSYKDLHPRFNTEMPYVFWNTMYKILLENENTKQ